MKAKFIMKTGVYEGIDGLIQMTPQERVKALKAGFILAKHPEFMPKLKNGVLASRKGNWGANYVQKDGVYARYQ
jgi:hypothetical protein